MNAGLLDVNFLVALFDPGHINHEDAHEWFGRHRKRGWATCPLTINGCVRVLSNPNYPSVQATAADVVTRLRVLCEKDSGHSFWPDSLSLLDETTFRPKMIAGPGQITDIYLLALAAHNGGKLVTFDRAISPKAVAGAGPMNIELVGGATGKAP